MPDPAPEPDPTPRPDRGRSSFGPVVLLGLASAALAAVASAKPWFGPDAAASSRGSTLSALDAGTRYPLASAISLVLLAAWGVLLVTRGRVRQTFALLAAATALALLVAVVAAHLTLPDTAGSSYELLMGRGSASAAFTGWFWTAAVCSVVALVPAALAVRLSGRWPEMSSRYDAPGARASVPADEGTRDPDRDLWTALDDGRDPTDNGRC